jgi:hypothetical protein
VAEAIAVLTRSTLNALLRGLPTSGGALQRRKRYLERIRNHRRPDLRGAHRLDAAGADHAGERRSAARCRNGLPTSGLGRCALIVMTAFRRLTVVIRGGKTFQRGLLARLRDQSRVASIPLPVVNLVKTCNHTRLVENDEGCENQEHQKTHNASYRVQFAPSAEQLGCLLRISIERRIQ